MRDRHLRVSLCRLRVKLSRIDFKRRWWRDSGHSWPMNQPKPRPQTVLRSLNQIKRPKPNKNNKNHNFRSYAATPLNHSCVFRLTRQNQTTCAKDPTPTNLQQTPHCECGKQPSNSAKCCTNLKMIWARTASTRLKDSWHWQLIKISVRSNTFYFFYTYSHIVLMMTRNIIGV